MRASILYLSWFHVLAVDTVSFVVSDDYDLLELLGKHFLILKMNK